MAADMHMVRASRCMLDASFAPRRGEKTLAQKRSEAFVFFRFVEGYSLAHALRATNRLHPNEQEADDEG